MSGPVTIDPEDKPDQKPNVIHLQSSTETLSKKIGNLLAIVHECAGIVYDTAEGDLPASKDKEVIDSAASTVIRACTRLDKLIDDDANWRIDSADTLLRERTEQLTAVNLKIAERRANYWAELSRPSVMRRANLFRQGNKFIAVMGDSITENSVFGEGPTPIEAYQNLDAVLNSMQHREHNG